MTKLPEVKAEGVVGFEIDCNRNRDASKRAAETERYVLKSMRFSTPNVSVLRVFVEATLRKALVDSKAKNKRVIGNSAAVTTPVYRCNVKI